MKPTPSKMKVCKRKRNCTESEPIHQRCLSNILIEGHTERLSEIQNVVHSYIQKKRTISTTEARCYTDVVVEIQNSKESTEDIQQVADKLLRQMKMIIKENAAKGNSKPDKALRDNFNSHSHITTAEIKSPHSTTSNIDVAVNMEDLSNKFMFFNINGILISPKRSKNPSNQFDSKNSSHITETKIVKKRNKSLKVKKINNKPDRKRAISENFSKSKKLYSTYETAGSIKTISNKKIDFRNDKHQDDIMTNQNNINYTKDNSINLPTINLKYSNVTETFVQVIRSNDETSDKLDLRTNKGRNNEFDRYSNAKISNIKNNFTYKSMMLGSNDETPDYLTAYDINKKNGRSDSAHQEKITTKLNNIHFTNDNQMNMPTTNLKNSSITEKIIHVIASNDQTPRTNKNKRNKGLNHDNNSKVSNIKINFANDYYTNETKKLSTDNTKNSSATPQFDTNALNIPQLPESLNTIPDSQNIDIDINTTISKCLVNPKINGKVTKYNATRKTKKNPRRKRNTVLTKNSQNMELLMNNCAVTESPTQSIKLNFGKKKILEDLTWVKNINFVRAIEPNEYLPIELNESFWKENVTFPGLKDEDFYI